MLWRSSVSNPPLFSKLIKIKGSVDFKRLRVCKLIAAASETTVDLAQEKKKDRWIYNNSLRFERK